MRVTTDMIFDRAIFNLSRNIERFMRVESVLSTGRRINKPSDDPIGTHHDLNYRSRLSAIEQHLSNISQGIGWMATYDNGLGELKDLYSAANEIAIMMANDTFDEVARQGAANEVREILEQVFQLINADVDGRYIYSGHRTRTQPFEVSTNGVVYRGDSGLVDIELDTSSRITSNLIGETIFLAQLQILGEKGDLQPGLLGSTQIADLHLGDGVDLSVGTFEIYDNNRDITHTVDVSGATTIDDVVNAINAQLGASAGLSVRIADTGGALQWEPTPLNTITADTPLSNLNGGAGVDQQSGKFVIRNGDSSIWVEVDISGATTVGEVMTSIAATLMGSGVSGVSVGFNADGTGLSLTDGNVPPLGLTIEEISADYSTAADLGIVGTLSPSLEGSALNPQPDFVIREIGSQTVAADFGLAGTVSASTIGGDLNPLLTMDTPLSALNNKIGFALGELKISHGDQIAIVDLGNASLTTVGDLLNAINSCGLEITAGINEAGAGIQIVSDVGGKSLIIESNDSSRTAHNLGIIGSSDMLGSMMLLVTALENNDREIADLLIGSMDLSMDELLSAVTRLLSEVEDADIVSAVSELAREENLYQAALMASSRIMQHSLIDFLR